MQNTAEDASNNNDDDGTDVSVFGHSLDGRLSRPTSSWKSQNRRPKFTSLDGDDLDLDLEILDLDDGDSSDDNADLVDLRNVVGQNRPTGNGRPFQSVTRKETDLVVPSDWISKSSPRTPRAWQDGGDLAELQTRGIRVPLVRRASGEGSASEFESNSSTDTLGSAKARRNSQEMKLGAERRLDARPRDFKDTKNEFASSVAGDQVVERYRAGEGREDGYPSRYGGDALIPVAQAHDVRYPTRPSLPRETKQLAYSHMRQKLRPIERRIEVPVETDEGEMKDVKSRKRNRLRPLMTKRARALIFGHGRTEDRMGAYGSPCVTQNVMASDRVNKVSRRAIRGIVSSSEPKKVAGIDAKGMEVVDGELEFEVTEAKIKPTTDAKIFSSLNKVIEAPVSRNDAMSTPRMGDSLFHQSLVKSDSDKMGESTEAGNSSASDPLESTANSQTMSEDQKNVHEANDPVKPHEVRRNSAEKVDAASAITSSRDVVGFRPKFVDNECFENSASLSRSWKSQDIASMYPAVTGKTSSSPGNLFYATHYSQFLPNDLNLEEFSLFDGEFTKSYRPSSPEPSEDVLKKPEARIPEAQPPSGPAPTLTMPTLRVSTASSVTAAPSEEYDSLAAPSPSIALSLSLSASMIADDDELATARSGVVSSRMNSDCRRLELTTVAPLMEQVVAPVEAPRMSREGPMISRSLVRSVSFADVPIVVPHKQLEHWSMDEQSDLSQKARSLAPAFSAAQSFVPSPPKLIPSRPAVVASPRLTAVTMPRTVAPTKQSSRIPSENLSSSPAKVPLRTPFSPSEETQPLAPSKVSLMTRFTPPEYTLPSPPKVPVGAQPLMPSKTAPQPLSFVPSYASPLKTDGPPFSNSAMYTPWGQQSLADMWSEAQKGLNQASDKTSFL